MFRTAQKSVKLTRNASKTRQLVEMMLKLKIRANFWIFTSYRVEISDFLQKKFAKTAENYVKSAKKLSWDTFDEFLSFFCWFHIIFSGFNNFSYEILFIRSKTRKNPEN